ncbi:unnamed protein product [Meloidogyne enterolobii]|uniref:Uncharacterized protein n=1 Tax=Meloidogyne enterolobii TaxID=390850 RepID=A0ACB0Y697_MELEN
MPYTSLPLVVLLIPFLWSLSFAIDKDDFSPKSGSKVCVGKIFFHYYDCCGQLLTDCCFKLQTWVIIVIAIVLICTLVSIVLSLIR